MSNPEKRTSTHAIYVGLSLEEERVIVEVIEEYP